MQRNALLVVLLVVGLASPSIAQDSDDSSTDLAPDEALEVVPEAPSDEDLDVETPRPEVPVQPDVGTPVPPPDRGPVIELAPEEEEETSAANLEPADIYTRGMRDQRFRQASSTPIGGYGELHFNAAYPEGGGPAATQVDLHRLVLFVAHNFSEEFRFYLELEVEHALAAPGAPGEVGVEQAFVDWRVLGEALMLRAGIVLVPMGIINQWHEPPIFHGVERPIVDNRIIPTTWREGGGGLAGEPIEGLRYELYVTGGLNALGFSGSKGIRGGRQGVAEALAGSPAVMGRLEIEPALGVIIGGSGYFNMAGQSAHLDIDVPVVGVSLDARLRLRGVEARAMAAFFSIGDVDRLRAMTDEDGISLGIDVGSALFGAYIEAGYDVLSLTDTGHSLVPFARFEWHDTTFNEGNTGFNQPSVTSGVFGLTYRPMPQLAIKFDYTLRRPYTGAGEDIVNLGVGWMF